METIFYATFSGSNNTKLASLSECFTEVKTLKSFHDWVYESKSIFENKIGAEAIITSMQIIR